MSYTYYIVSKSVLYILDSVKKCLIDSLSVLSEVLDKALSEAGGKGLFTKELDVKLLNGDVPAAAQSTPPTFPSEHILSK